MVHCALSRHVAGVSGVLLPAHTLPAATALRAAAETLPGFIAGAIASAPLPIPAKIRQAWFWHG